MNKLLFILPLFLFATANAGYVNFLSCTRLQPIGAPPNWVWIDGCEGATCNVQNGEYLRVRAGFDPQHTSHNLRFNFGIWFFGIPIPFPPPESAEIACTLLDGGCPLIAGSAERAFTYEFLVESPLAVSGNIEVELLLMDSDNNHPHACAKVFVQLAL